MTSGLIDAIALKKVIDGIDKYSISMGECITDLENFKEEHNPSSEEEDDDDEKKKPEKKQKRALREKEFDQEAFNRIESCLGCYQKKFDCYDLESKDFCITVNGKTLDGFIDEEDDEKEKAQFDEWYNSSEAQVSGFGDVRTLETKIDPEVRTAKEIRNVQVDPKTLQALTEMWGKCMYPTEVRLQVDKLNLYPAGGKFTCHKDTPEKNLLGTMVLTVAANAEIEDDKYPFYLDKEGFYMSIGTVLMFFTDVPHEVSVIEQGYRATLTFKVFAWTSPRAPEIEVRQSLASTLKEYLPPYGFLLSHEYARGDSVMKGADQILVETLRAMAEEGEIQVELLPVVTKFDGSWDTTGDYRDEFFKSESNVYPLNDYVVYKALGKTNYPSGSEDQFERVVHNSFSIPFYRFEGNSALRWKHEVDAGAAHAGNECRPGDENSLYVEFAVVVLPKPDAKEQKTE